MSSEQSPSSAQAVPAPRCYRHPDRETWVRCTRCDRPICPDCLRPAAVGFQCPECVARGNAGVRRATTRFGGRVSERAGLVTIVLIALNVVFFVATAATSPTGFFRPTSSRLFGETVLVPNLVGIQGEYWRLVTSAFLHLSVLHLAVNMLALWVVGMDMERALGLWRYLSVYLLSALGGSVAVYVFDNRINGVAGASGAIFGLFGATVVVVRKMGLDPRSILVILGINLVLTFSLSGISWLGHLGGLALGLVTAVIIAYSPAGPRRTLLHAAGLASVLLVLLLLIVYRTSVLQQTIIG